jgi:hypothetical protein
MSEKKEGKLRLEDMKKADLIREVRDFIRRVKYFGKEADALAFFGEELSYALNRPEKMTKEELRFVVENIDKVLTTEEILWDFDEDEEHRMKRICRGCIYWDGESCLNPNMPDDYWENLLYGDRESCDYKEQPRRRKKAKHNIGESDDA